ncbi:hypothetical protein QQ045_009395 [Rhodiola kirilowii]
MFAVRSLRDVVRTSRPQIVALLETKINKRKCESIRVQLGFQYYFCVPANGKSRGLSLLWQSEIDDSKVEGELIHVPKLVTNSQNTLLTQPFTEREIIEALFQLYPSKAPGLNGFHAGFYQKHRSIVKHNFITSCMAALNEGTIHPHVNDTDCSIA